MPTLPDYTALGERQQPRPAGGVATYRPDQGPDVGGAVAAGRDLENAAAIVAETNQRQDTIVAQSAANDLSNSRATLEYDPKNGFRSAQEGAAVGPEFLKTYTQKLKDSSQSIREGLTTETQKRIFDQHFDAQALQFRSALLQHQATQTERFNDSTDNATIKLANDAIAQRPTDTLVFAMKMAEIEATVKSAAARKGLSSEATTALMQTSKEGAIVTRIQSLLHGIPGVVEPDPDTAMALFKMEQPNMSAAAAKALTPELLQVGVATKAQQVGAQIAGRYDHLHTAEAVTAIDAMNMPPMMKIAVRAEVEHRHAVMQSDADKSNAVYIGKLDEMVQRGMSLPAISATPEFQAVRDKGTVLKLIRERTEHAINLQNAIESRDYTRAQRIRSEQEYQGLIKSLPYSDPMVLAGMTRPQVEALKLELGPHTTERLLQKWDSFDKSTPKLREAKMDNDQFNTIADSLGLHPFQANTEDKKRSIATAKDRVEAGIAQWQAANVGKEMPRPEKEKLMRNLIATEITVGGWWDSRTNLLQVPESDVGKVVVPDVDKGQITVRLRAIRKDPNYVPTPEELGRAYLQRKQQEAYAR